MLRFGFGFWVFSCILGLCVFGFRIFCGVGFAIVGCVGRGFGLGLIVVLGGVCGVLVLIGWGGFIVVCI